MNNPKEVLLSVQPKLCEQIVNRIKAMIVRETKPELSMPFRCYIHCKESELHGNTNLSNRVVGEFMCSRIDMIRKKDELNRYGSKSNELPNELYVWHISDLVVYREPKELTDFTKVTEPPQSWCYIKNKGDREVMKGYKVFKPDWTCRGYKFTVGKTFEEDETPICCMRGFHFCKEVADCFNYYDFNPNNKVAEVEAFGDIDVNKDGNKYSTNKIRIVREISWYEVLDMVNLGKGCTGLRNSGDYNSGFYNQGNYNTGNCNGGDCNSGGKNSGNYNSGYFNSGVRNSGDGNIGNYNSGNYNSGDWNSGNYNSGDYNCGDWNKGNFSNGCFNRELPKIFMFDKPSDWTYQDWLNSDARFVLSDCPVDVDEWVRDGEMTDKEKEQYPGYSVMGGFLRSAKKEGERQEWWDRLAKEKKDAIMKLPNFDKDIFKEITGIDMKEMIE